MAQMDKLKDKIISTLSKNETTLDSTYITIGRKPYTKRMIINEISNGTEVGNDIINNLILLTVDLLNRQKINTNL